MQGNSTRPGLYKCKDCRKPFSVTIGTVMERSHVPLSKWVLAAQLMASSKKGFSALQLQRMIGTNYETAWLARRSLALRPAHSRGHHIS
jgi:transposase-like protein